VPRRLPKLTVGAGPRAALLDARTSLLDAPWRLARASVLKRRWVLCRVVADGSTNMVRGARLELRAPLIIRNHLPVAVDLQVMQQQGTDRRCAAESHLQPGESLAVSSVDVRDYCWLNTRTGSTTWVSAKINSRSWRRAVAASRALGRRPPKRRKALEASSSCGYVLDVSTPDGDLSLGPLLSTGSAPAVALECTLRAPCVVVAHPARDYGPATKLVGAVEALRRDPELLEKAGGDREDAVVVAADDDHEWEPFALATLLHVGFSSSSAPVGYDAAKTVWTYYSYPFPRGRPVADAVCVAQAGDMLAAPLSLFGELERWGRELLPGGGLPSCFFVDDLFFAAYAAYHRSTVYTHPWRRWLFREARRPRPISPFRSRRWRRRGAASPRRRLTYASHGVVQRSRSGGSGRASPRSSPARRAAARRKRCS